AKHNKYDGPLTSREEIYGQFWELQLYLLMERRSEPPELLGGRIFRPVPATHRPWDCKRWFQDSGGPQHRLHQCCLYSDGKHVPTPHFLRLEGRKVLVLLL